MGKAILAYSDESRLAAVDTDLLTRKTSYSISTREPRVQLFDEADDVACLFVVNDVLEMPD